MKGGTTPGTARPAARRPGRGSVAQVASMVTVASRCARRTAARARAMGMSQSAPGQPSLMAWAVQVPSGM
ncbi:MAG: hypothetical protein H6705_03570 [Myxococcales bacterium]|nr:hypothetical protein [Myxococcales bacterium]